METINCKSLERVRAIGMAGCPSCTASGRRVRFEEFTCGADDYVTNLVATCTNCGHVIAEYIPGGPVSQSELDREAKIIEVANKKVEAKARLNDYIQHAGQALPGYLPRSEFVAILKGLVALLGDDHE